MSYPSRRSILTAAIGAFAGAGLWSARSRFFGSAGATPPAPTGSGRLTAFHRTSRALGTNVSLTLAHTEEAAANRAAAAAFAELERVEQSLSVYRPDSTLGRLNATGSLAEMDEHLRAVLSASLAMSRRTGGAFDVTVQPLWELHSRAAREKRAPTAAELADVAGRIDWRSVRIDRDAVRFDKPGMAITFNGIGQGYATDRATQVLREQGIKHALIDIGELAPLGQKSPGQPWQAGIQHPREDDAYIAVAKLDGRCLATSGDYATTFGSATRDHHIFDPATGHSPTELASVSVVAPTAMEADALSTSLFVLGLERGKALVERSKNVDALFVTKDGRVVKTEGFPEVNG